MIRHAGLFLTAAVPVVPLVPVMIEPPFRALLVPSVGPPPLLPAGLIAAWGAAIAVSAITVRADEEHCLALLTETNSMKENRFAVHCRHALSQAGLDNGTRFVAGWNQLCLVLPDEGCRTRNPAASNGRVPSLHASDHTILRSARLLMIRRMTAPAARMMSLSPAQAQKTTISDDR
ncbi:MAG: hypothetical protein JJE04_23990 [Acidobacteriia bacterium]|nr:hypothetical protein [Terriglobia bacterium]